MPRRPSTSRDPGRRAPGGALLGRLLLAAAGGLCIWASFPGIGWSPTAVLGVALLALSTVSSRSLPSPGADGTAKADDTAPDHAASRPRLGRCVTRGAVLGLVAGLTSFAPLLAWAGVYVGDLPWVGLFALESLYLALIGGVCGLLQRHGRIHPLGVALAWVASEALRGRTPYGGFPWVRLAFSQADSPLGRLASVAGAPGVTFAVALAGGLLAVAVLAAVRSRHTPIALIRVLTPMVGLAAVVLTGLLVPVASGAGAPTARILAIQGNVPQAGLDFNAQRRAVLDNHVQETLTAAAQVAAGTREQPDLVVWPENSSDIDPLRNPDAQAEILQAVAAIGAPTLVGTLSEEPWPDLYNLTYLYTPGEGITARYIKQHPVPFAEYIPQRDFYRRFSSAVDLVEHPFLPGPGPVIFTAPTASGTAVQAGPLICFEVAYDDLAREDVALGANVLVVQTNNATFGFTDESAQQLAISRIRAMEHGRAVVHVSTVGISSIVLPDGTATQPTSLFSAAAISGDVPMLTGTTVAHRLGDWPERVACGGLVLLLLGSTLRRHHHHS